MHRAALTSMRLSRHALNNYLYARTVIGREFSTPAVERPLH